MTTESSPTISVERIRNELNNLWASHSSTEVPVIRAQTHNLIVHCADDYSAQQTTEHVIAMTAERPGRVILIDVEKGRTKPPDSIVTTYCRAVRSDQVCGEVITLTTSPARKHELYSTVLSLLSPDLPVYVWWHGTPNAQDELFRRLKSTCDRLIIDSAGFDDLPDAFQVINTSRTASLLGDLNWARLTIWRQQFAAVWDRTALLPYLSLPNRIDFSLAGARGTDPTVSGLLMTGWLASALSWELDGVDRGKSKLSMIFNSKSRAGIEVHLTESISSTTSHNQITSVRLEFGSVEKPLKVSIKYQDDDRAIRSEIAMPGTELLTCSQSCADLSDAALLVDELDVGFDDEYDRAVVRLMEIVGAIHQQSKD